MTATAGSTPTAPYIAVEEIYGSFGETMAERGQEYANEHRVLTFTQRWHDERILVCSAKVEGTRKYHTRLALQVSEDSEQYQVIDAVCTCPIGSFCKHGAAVAFTCSIKAAEAVLGREANTEEAEMLFEEHMNPADLAPSPESDLFQDADADEQTETTVHSGPDWRHALGALLPREQPEEDYTEVGLGVELFAAHTGGAGSWARRYMVRWETARPQDVTAGRALSIRLRPLRKGTRGRWIKGGLNWTTFEHRVPVSSNKYWPEQALALHRLVQLYNSSVSVLGSQDLINLSLVSSPQIWDLLRSVLEAQIPLIAYAGCSEVELCSEGEPYVDLQALDADLGEESGMRIGIKALVDQHSESLDGAIGSIGFYQARAHQAAEPSIGLRIIPSSQPLESQLLELLDQNENITVPAADVPEFFDNYYPGLNRVLSIGSADHSVDLPEIPPAVLDLRVAINAESGTTTSRQRDTVRVSARWSYQGTQDQTEHMAQVLTAAREYWPDADRGSFVYTGATAAIFIDQILPQLHDMDYIQVTEMGDKPDYEQLDGEPSITISATPSAQRDWFDLGFQITVGETTVPFTDVFSALVRGENSVLLPDKTYFTLDHSAFDELRRLIAEATELHEWDPEAPTVSRFEPEVLSYAEEIATRWEVDPRVSAWMNQLDSLRGVADLPPAEVPETVNAELRDYQVQGFRWLVQLWHLKLGGILADDMGLGKTLQTLALVDYARTTARQDTTGNPEGPFLVIAPSSVVGVWKSEAERFVPHLNVTVLDTSSARLRTDVSRVVEDSDLVVTSYAIARLDADRFAEHTWGGIILDEAQFVKNHRTKAHKAIRSFQAPFWLAITGTPMENALSDLWSILNLTVPGLFGSYATFRDTYQKPIEAGQRISAEQRASGEDAEIRGKAAERMNRLRQRIKPIMLRRTKDVVAQELPEKQEQTITVRLNPEHRRLYDRVLQRERQKVLHLIQDFDSNRMNVFRSLTLLRMLALDPQIVDEEYRDVESSKLTDLMQRLQLLVADGHRVIVFSQFTSFLHRVAETLTKHDIAHSYLDGATRNRSAVIEQFRAGDIPVFLISLKAGGFGLTLTEADYVFLLDPWWNPAAEAQAVDRTHRIGQDRRVMVYRMVAEGTIEEKVVELQRAKAELFSSLTEDDTAFSSSLGAEDILALFDAGASTESAEPTDP
ncbi:DEAD/DEAH box helicase [Auritidibacter ignavus]|uniref:DEAD/DEAH box helicase n=1 Tax=Auritidibacter ignavus TaxID=678932 RepID=UPI00244B3B90|nr:DEAD/DEAH box helicase [Auritidibacter ignavus]WGH90503.1 DEAD/DEAH box helicase [Auritidibacter ignavus]